MTANVPAIILGIKNLPTATLIMDGGLPNYRPTRLNDSGNFVRPLKKIDDFSTFLFFI